jgi:BirA family biotin operon repressor/biotin-[acetyl-CoA-carboxylase] ligase
MRTELIELLADGEWHSGADLARRLGCSRTAIWKRLQQLEALDLDVDATPGRGYRLARAVELLDDGLIRKRIDADVAGAIESLEVLAVTESTNEILRSGPPATPGLARIVIAEYQTGGRGRRGRRWLSPFGSGLCFSAAWTFPEPPPNLPALSLAAGVAVSRAVSTWAPANIGLKWPNDIVVGDRKLGGLLIDVQGESDGPIATVVGVGINVDGVGGLASRFDAPGGLEPVGLRDVADGREVSRNAVAAAIASELIRVLRQFQATGFAALADEWRRLDAMRGRQVNLQSGDRARTGVAAGIDDDGALLLDDAGRIVKVVAGEVTLRGVSRGNHG